MAASSAALSKDEDGDMDVGHAYTTQAGLRSVRSIGLDKICYHQVFISCEGISHRVLL